ncbi:hypothetical protein [Sphingobacterium bambusae]|uniref:Peptidase S9 prolyl oligopeptidase catalytic domain-containing protein n=2 Tax=Sphingobacterium bambusae TaxID=662858 RepID=A0ABW6BBF3_9SPHI|nr:hypothetical protein [Sphingobacterium bambusae]WPL46932.1 hypothetical protein SCB77_13265 [Sphingobacterium bambusae]
MSNHRDKRLGVMSPQVADTAYVKSFFLRNLEVERLGELSASYYRQWVKTSDLEENKSKLWSLWVVANQARMSSFMVADSLGKEFIWELPSDERMKVETFTKGRRPLSGYPFFINLHGGGSDPSASTAWGADFNTEEWRAAKMLGRRYADAPSYYFVPRMANDKKGRWYLKPQQMAWLRAWQLAALSKEVNPNRTYILGISEGGYGSFRMGTFYADYFAGIGPMAGPETAEAAPIENLRNTAIRIEVGEDDRGFGRNQMGLDWRRRLDSASLFNPGQFKHVVNVQKGRGHGIDYKDVSSWLSQHTRKIYPDTLSFLYYPIDGAYRLGFGYVRLDHLHSADGRLLFHLVKQGNVYHVTTKTIRGQVDGKIAIYLDKVDYRKSIVVFVNGKRRFRRVVRPNLGVMIESLALFGDPERIFSGKVEVSVE